MNDPQFLIDPTKDYYSVLRVGEEASAEQIKKAYKKLALKYHPDRPGGDPEKMRAINSAHDILGSFDKKQYYDQMRKEYLFTKEWDYSSAHDAKDPFDFGFWSSSNNRHLRDIVIDSLRYFQHNFGIEIPDEVLNDFQEAVDFVFYIWEEYFDKEEDIKYAAFGGFRIPWENREEISERDSLND